MKTFILMAVAATLLAACEDKAEAPVNGYDYPSNQTPAQDENPRYSDGSYK